MKSCHLRQHGGTLRVSCCEKKSDRESQILYDFTHTQNIKNKETKISEQIKPKQKQTCRYRLQISGYQKGRGQGNAKQVKQQIYYYIKILPQLKILIIKKEDNIFTMEYYSGMR